jgi:hypothetical protein
VDLPQPDGPGDGDELTAPDRERRAVQGTNDAIVERLDDVERLDCNLGEAGLIHAAVPPAGRATPLV